MIAPQVCADVAGELLAESAGGYALERAGQPGQGGLGRVVRRQVHVITFERSTPPPTSLSPRPWDRSPRSPTRTRRSPPALRPAAAGTDRTFTSDLLGHHTAQLLEAARAREARRGRPDAEVFFHREHDPDPPRRVPARREFDPTAARIHFGSGDAAHGRLDTTQVLGVVALRRRRSRRLRLNTSPAPLRRRTRSLPRRSDLQDPSRGRGRTSTARLADHTRATRCQPAADPRARTRPGRAPGRRSSTHTARSSRR